MLVPSCAFEQFKATQEEKRINPTLQDNVLLLDNFADHMYHVESSHDMHSIIQSGLFRCGKDANKGRRAVFFTAVNPMFIDHYREGDNDVTKPWIAVFNHNWKIPHQNTVTWCNLRVATSKGLQSYQMQSNSIIFCNSLLAMCIEKVVIMCLEKNCTAKRISLLLQRKELC